MNRLFLALLTALVLTMPALAHVGPTVPVTEFLAIDGGTTLGHAGFIPPTATSDTGDLTVPPETAVAPAQVCETMTVEDFKEKNAGAITIIAADDLFEFGKGSGIIARFGPMPADIDSAAFAWPPVGPDSIYIAFFDKAGCGNYEIYLSPDAVRAGVDDVNS